MRTRVKFCGCTNWREAEAAIEAGADAIGMIFAHSSRRIEWEAVCEIAKRLPPLVTPVGVFADPKRAEIEAARDLMPQLVVQLHGNESGTFVSELGGEIVKVIHVSPTDGTQRLAHRCEEFTEALVMFDTARQDGHAGGGTGIAFAWEHVAPIARLRPIVVAGGLTPENVGECVRAVRPFAVDARSGIETNGKKDRVKMEAFIQAVREADEA